ncbi:MAG: efflux RND transporter periplasmic adaptor subunit [Deltaproteobacteria bacterium]|nr:efflux RND transporter periplasmic adaptor subunit [Deltaproteobacteria bacterium]MDZ4346632.1 efflux RND transporter periplasmic adaptor subunit [Candidatus Binatia bacterium]
MRRSYWIGALVVVVGGFAGFQQYHSWSLNKPQEKSDGRPAGAVGGERGQGRGGGRSREAVPVLVATAQQKAIPIQIRAVGNAEPFATVSVKSQVTGVLMQAHFKEGQNVKKGQMLFTIDPRPFEAAVKQTEANLARDVAQLQNAREQARRYAELLKKQYVSQEQYDQIRTNADALESVVDADKAAVETAKVQLSYCYIYSPIDGQVGSLLVNEGNLVRVNDGTPLVVINQLSPINVTFSVPEQHLGEIKRQMAAGALKVDARFQSDEGRPEQGTLAFVDNAVERTTGTIKLKAEFKNTAKRLWPGQFINVAVTLSTQADAVVIPSEAVQVGPEGQQVFIVKEDKRVEVRPVTVGQTQEGEAVIAKGLVAGELVVREGQFLLGPGSQVDIKEANKTTENKEGKKAQGAGGKRKPGQRGAS